MAINTLATETLFQRTLDKLAVQEAVTGWMDANAGQVIYSGGKEVKIPKLSVQGLANYDRDNGYVMGGARHHDLWVLENKIDSVFVSIKDAE